MADAASSVTSTAAPLPEEAAAGVVQLRDAVVALESTFAPLLSLGPGAAPGRLSAADQAKLRVFTAYSVNSLFYMFLKTQGETTANHPVMKELDRVKEYFGKLKDATTGKPKSKPSSSSSTSSGTPTARVDKAAASRFIKHGTGRPAKSSPEQTRKHKDDKDSRHEKKSKGDKEKSKKKEKEKEKERSEEPRRSSKKRKSEEAEEGERKPSKRPKPNGDA